MRALRNHLISHPTPLCPSFLFGRPLIQIISLTQSEARKQNSSHMNFRIDSPNPPAKRVLAALGSLTGFAPAILEVSLLPSDARLQLLYIGRDSLESHKYDEASPKHHSSFKAYFVNPKHAPPKRMVVGAWWTWLRTSMAPALTV